MKKLVLFGALMFCSLSINANEITSKSSSYEDIVVLTCADVAWDYAVRVSGTGTRAFYGSYRYAKDLCDEANQ